MSLLYIFPVTSKRKGKEPRSLTLWKQKNIYFQWISVKFIKVKWILRSSKLQFLYDQMFICRHLIGLRVDKENWYIITGSIISAQTGKRVKWMMIVTLSPDWDVECLCFHSQVRQISLFRWIKWLSILYCWKGTVKASPNKYFS